MVLPDRLTALPGFAESGDAPGRWPLVLASPHSGRDYPAEFLASTRLTLAQLRRAEDAFVDILLDGAVGLGVPRLAARYGRSWLDLNRAAEELDPSMFIEPMEVHGGQGSDRVRAGLGVVPRVAAQGLDIYPTRLRLGDAQARIAEVHAPWHDRIDQLTSAARDRHGYAILLDCHSMPSPAPAVGGAAQVVLGDLHGTSAAPALVDWLERCFTAAGLRVARNAPYAGGYTTARHGRPRDGIHAVQIELDRALYMDPARLVRHLGFQAVTATMTTLAATLMRNDLGLGSTGYAIAAE
ncbi:N-formylglutamate amidohydrolase [Glacieibacterium sp.]|uniref:N-formylglutamate amidohydrolase n=1 Tax=Glacieibacterium sp. TaxID=2860237 RepID=UPI003B0050E7